MEDSKELSGRSSEPRIGVFVCKCGGNIGDVIDVGVVCDEAGGWRGVRVAKYHDYLCSEPAQEMIVQAVKERGLDRVIVASCTPRMHLPTFQRVMERAGLNPYLLEFVNVREQCSWVHGSQKEEATCKAISLIRGAYERSIHLEPLEQISEKCTKNVLVVGGGIAGIASSIELGNLGHRVHLVERYPTIGGHMAKLTKVFPTLDCAQCILTPKMAEAGRHENVSLITNAEVQDVEGYPGNYKVSVYIKPRGVQIERCIGCGTCAKVCPVTCPDEFNERKSTRKAAYIPFRQAIPYAYTIDFSACTLCGRCSLVCPRDAIDLEDKGRTVDLNVGAIVVATGYDLYDPKELPKFGYGNDPDIITVMDLERLTSISGPTGGVVRRFSGGEAKRVAMVLCAGSRDTRVGVPYCSRICCMYSIKHAVLLKEVFEVDVWVYYIDMRATGRGYEELYARAQDMGVVFVRGRVSSIERDTETDKLIVRSVDTLLGKPIDEAFDLVALAVPMVPPPDLDSLSRKLMVSVGEDGFLQEKHPKLYPVDLLTNGVFACGCALGPKDIRDTVSDALAAAAEASALLGKGQVMTSVEKPVVDRSTCNGCGICLRICPSRAVTMSDEGASINPYLCTGCGACVPECPERAIDFKNSTESQVLAQINGVLADKGKEEIRVVAFVEKTIAYTGVDFLGLDRLEYPTEVRVIPVPSTAFLGLRHLLHAFTAGADGVVLIEGKHDMDERFMRERAKSLAKQLEENGIESSRLWYSLVEIPAYRKIAGIFNSFTTMLQDMGPVTEEARGRLHL